MEYLAPELQMPLSTIMFHMLQWNDEKEKWWVNPQAQSVKILLDCRQFKSTSC